MKCLKELSKSWGVTFQKLGLGVSDSAILMQHRVPVCAFCSQFFDPDAFSGLSKSRRKKRAKFTQHFDDAYPDTYSKPKIKEEDDENVKRSRKASMAFVKNKLAEWEDMGITDSEKFKFDNSEDIRLGDQMEHSKNRNVNLKGTDTAIHAVDSLEHSLESFQHSKNAIYSPNASPEHEHSVRPATAPTHPTFDNTPPFESLTTNMNAFDNESLSLVSGDPEHGDAKQHKVYHSDKKELVKEEQDFVGEKKKLENLDDRATSSLRFPRCYPHSRHSNSIQPNRRVHYALRRAAQGEAQRRNGQRSRWEKGREHWNFRLRVQQ